MTDKENISFNALPVVIIGAGGIVNTAHLPAYRLAGYPVQGIFDTDQQKAEETAHAFSIPVVYKSIEDLQRQIDPTMVVDLAVPAIAIPSLLNQLPDKTNLLMQKPMGEDLAMAKQILGIVHRKKMLAAVNFQLRYAPSLLEAKRMIAEGQIGELLDIEVNVNVFTPWHLWDFLFAAPRVEILYHSIHYIDLVRNLLGNPESIYAKTSAHPLMKQLASVRSAIIMGYGPHKRATILTNHCHQFGNDKQHAYIKLEGTAGAIKIGLGVLQDYPNGVPDTFEYFLLHENKKQWQTKEINGSWFPHAFIGSMEQIMLAAAGKISRPDNTVEDAIHTMAWVEAAYRSDKEGGQR